MERIKKSFEGTEDYIVSEDLRNSVHVALALSKPLLLKGEPGTGKTLLAKSIADSLGLDLIIWNIKSTTKAQDGLYVYDTVQRLYDSQFGNQDVGNIKKYIKLGKLGEAFISEKPKVVLIDEIDKADLEFPNDLLWELDQMNFYIPETGETISAKHRPIVIITTNAEKELPDPFLRRCIFHYITFPEPELMEKIVRVHFPKLEDNLLGEALKSFYWLRSLSNLRKKPTTSELLDWVQALNIGGISPSRIYEELPFLGTLIKKNEDFDILRRRIQNRENDQTRQSTNIQTYKNW